MAYLRLWWRRLIIHPRDWAAAIGYLVAVCLCVGFIQVGRYFVDEEPFEWFEGISAWPGYMLRVVAIALGIALFIKHYEDLKKDRRRLQRDYRLPNRPAAAEFWLLGWKPAPHGLVDSCGMWSRYLALSRGTARAVRALTQLAPFLLLTVGIFLAFGWPPRLYRGPISAWVDFLTLYGSFAVSAMLLWFIFDSTRLCRSLVRFLCEESDWGDAIVHRHLQRLRWPVSPDPDTRRIQHAASNCRIDMSIIARRTQCVEAGILYPFFILTVLALSSHNRIDAFAWTLPVIITFVFAAGMTLLAQHQLERTAVFARTRTLAQMHHLVQQAHDPEVRRRLEGIVQDIETEHRGAFAPLLEKPVVRAILLPFGGLGAAELLDYAGPFFG